MTEKLHLDDENAEKYFCFTKVNTGRLSFEWKIYNFSVTSKETGESLSSPVFSPTANENIKCYIKLYPRGKKEEHKDYLSLFLHLSFENSSKIEVNFSFCLLDKYGKKTNNCKTNYIFLKTGYGFPTYIKRDLLNESYLLDDCLTIVCDISLGLNHVTSHNRAAHINLKANEKPQLQLLNDYESFFNNQEFSDIKIIISDKTLYAHKVILAAHSPVLLAMFNSDMKENKENEIKIVDIEFNVFQELLRFIYTGKIEDMDHVGRDLLFAADKYAIKGLLIKCEQYFQSNLNLSNVIDIICLADNYNAVNLKEIAMNFFIKNKKDIDTNNAEFLTMIKQLAAEDIAKLWVTK